MTRFIIAAMLAVALCPGLAIAQVGTVGGAPTPSALGMTSPLGIGAPPPVAPTGIPLGATEIVPPGTSPGTTRAVKSVVSAAAPSHHPELEADATAAFAQLWAADAHWAAVEAVERKRRTS